MSDDDGLPPPFSNPVFLQMPDEWICVADATQALECLQERFTDQSGPSYQRAIAAAQAAISGAGPMELARVTLVVAAMEAGFQFEVIDDEVQAFERQIELEAENGLRSILLDLQDGPDPDPSL